MDALSASDALHERVQACVTRGVFDEALVLDIARHQATRGEAVGRLYRARGIDLAALSCVDEIPGVPTDAWKRVRIATHDAAHDRATFLTSGTTLGARGVHALRRTDTYELAARTHGARWLGLDAPHDLVLLVLDDPSSSLGHMCRDFGRAFAATTTECFRAAIDVDAFVASTRGDRPVLVAATSFALVHLLDALGCRRCPLPAGSTIVQTGGFKGRSREVSADALRASLSETLATPAHRVVAEYGMTELGSQGYETTRDDPSARHGVYRLPPWCRVSVVDPATNAPLPVGELGLLRFVDPVNVDSSVAVQTQDLGRAIADDVFELQGRLEGATPRGCSLAIEELEGRA